MATHQKVSFREVDALYVEDIVLDPVFLENIRKIV